VQPAGAFIEQGKAIKINLYSSFITESFGEYIRHGGLPYLINLNSDTLVVTEYLTGIYNTILLKDVVKRFNVRNVNFLENLVIFLAGNLMRRVREKLILSHKRMEKNYMFRLHIF
jgi:hypothetical protein